MNFPTNSSFSTSIQFNLDKGICLVAILSMLIGCHEGRAVTDREKETVLSMKSIAYVFHSNANARSDLVELARSENVSNSEIVGIWERHQIKPEHEGVIEIDRVLADGWRMPFRFEVSGSENAGPLCLTISSLGPNRNDDFGSSDDLSMEFQIYPEFVLRSRN